MQISGLNPSSQFSADDVLAIEINGVTYKLTGAVLAATLRTIGGALPVTDGGTGLTASPSMLVNVGSNNAADVLQASPRPGVTGVLGIANGGTGATAAADAARSLGQGVELALAGGASSITLTNTTGAIQILDSAYFDQYKFFDFYFGFQSGFMQCQRLWADGYKTYKGGFFAYNQSDSYVRGVAYAFTTNGRYIQNVNVLVSYDYEAWAQNNNSLILYKVFGFK